MLVVGLLSTKEEAAEIQYIAKIVVVTDRIKSIAKKV